MELRMRICLCLLVVSLPLHFFVQAQTILKPAASGYAGTGAYSLTHSDAFSFTSNQAALAQTKQITGGIYGERRYMLAELSLYNAVAVLPTHSGNFGLKTGYYGFSDYNETQVGLAYGRSLGSKADIGIQFNYYNIKVAGYGHAAALGFEAGVIMHLTEKLNAGVHVANPAGGKFGKNAGEKLPFVYTAGLGYEGSRKFFISAEVEKEEDQPVTVNAGIQYKFLSQVLARAGISTATAAMWLGIGVSIRSLRVDVTAAFHPQLGITPGLMILFNVPTQSKNEEGPQ